MADLTDLLKVETLTSAFDVIQKHPTSTFLSLVGLFWLLVGAFSANTVLKAKPEEVRGWQKLLLFGSLCLGACFSIAGPTLSIAELSKESLRGFSKNQLSQAAILERIKANAEVKWLVRLIPHDPSKQPELQINRLTHLGSVEHRYAFVADYAELRGLTVAEAVQRIGGSMRAATRVSAIIFPLEGRQLFPANARGVLQVIQEIESTRDPAKQNYLPFNITSHLSKIEISDLETPLDRIHSWSWNSYGQYYKSYCTTAQKLRCDKFSAKLLMGDLGRDWHPLGFSSKVVPTSEPCSSPELACAVPTWDQASGLEKNIGARAFLLGNLELNGIPGRILLDFHEPRTQVIPDLGVPE